MLGSSFFNCKWTKTVNPINIELVAILNSTTYFSAGDKIQKFTFSQQKNFLCTIFYKDKFEKIDTYPDILDFQFAQ